MRFRFLLLLVAFCLFGSGSLLAAQEIEIEPNQPCFSAQDFGPVSFPFAVSGSLDPPPDQGDVDFYRFEGIPITAVRVDLEGQATGKGTLGDPFLGFFDSSCNLIEVNDDSGSVNSRLFITIPPDGVFIVGATSCCDHTFQGNPGVSGSYQVTITPVTFASSIQGQVVDAITGEPLPGFGFPFTVVSLFRCTGGLCEEHVAAQNADFDGRFQFVSSGPNRVPLLAGTYQLRVFANTYVEAQVGPFEIGEGEDVFLGDVPLNRPPAPEGVTGRIIDAVSGTPLAGMDSPFASVELRRCDDSGSNCFQFVNFQRPDAQGRFRFERDFVGAPLLVGTYKLLLSASEYEPGETAPFFLEIDELEDLGDVPLMPFPISFSQVSPCGDLSPDGGLCRFSVRINNRLNEPVDGAAWSLVQASGIGTLTDFTMFQLDTVHRMTIPAGRSRLALFGFEVPGTIRNGSNLCVEMYFGRDRRRPFFNTVGRQFLFCIQKGLTGQLTVLSEKESRRLIREREKAARPSPMRKDRE
jgi:hypothetical protein